MAAPRRAVIDTAPGNAPPQPKSHAWMLKATDPQKCACTHAQIPYCPHVLVWTPVLVADYYGDYRLQEQHSYKTGPCVDPPPAPDEASPEIAYRRVNFMVLTCMRPDGLEHRLFVPIEMKDSVYIGWVVSPTVTQMTAHAVQLQTWTPRVGTDTQFVSGDLIAAYRRLAGRLNPKSLSFKP
jgi:hypothetical protein